ncbi:hypothetical protein HN51_002431 [Arachis hypogaea]
MHPWLSLFLAFFIAFFRLPILFLYALQTYIHPNAQPSTSNGLRAAIRCPSAPKALLPTSESAPRIKTSSISPHVE